MGRFEPIGTVQPFLKLQEGIWADVYKAYDTSKEQHVLLKKLRSEYSHDEAVARRFEDEARLMARIQHPNVVSILDHGHGDQGVYFIAEFIDGISLDERLREGGIPVMLATYIVREIAAGLQAAHERHIFHRDIKPSNVLLSVDGRVKLTDFGMASLMETGDSGEVRGTLNFLAPELVFEGEPSVASDLFALGATYYEMLAGRPAFHGASPSEVFDQVLHHDPIPFLAANPNLPGEALDICRRLLAKEPASRYPDCQSLMANLDALLARVPAFDGRKALAAYLEAPDAYRDPPLERTAVPAPVNGRSHEALDTPGRHTPRWIPAAALLLSAAFLGMFAATTRQQSAAPDDPPGPAGTVVSENGPTQEDTLSTSVERVPAAVPDEVLDEPANQMPAPVPDRPLTAETDPALPALPAAMDTAAIAVSDTSAPEPEKPAFGDLHVLCTPHCEVYINRQYVGAAPPILPARLPAGVHQLTLKNPGFPEYTREVVVEAGRSDSLLVALRDFVGTLEVNVFPWAEVTIDSVQYGVIPPIQTITLAPGQHTVTLSHRELGSWTTTIIIAAGERQTRTFNLKELKGL